MTAKSNAGIALVIADLDSGGTQRVATTLANAWASQGRRVCVITLAGTETDFFKLDGEIERRVIGFGGMSRSVIDGLIANLRRVWVLRRNLREFEPRFVVSFVGPVNVLLILAAIGLNARVIISERNDPARQSFGPLWDRLCRALYRFADVVSANSRGALETLSAYVPPAKLALVPNPVPIPSRAEVAAKPARDGVILAVGRLHRQKAYDVLLDAMVAIAEAAPQWRLEIAGDGPLRMDLSAQAERLGIGERVVWHGRVADLYPLYRSASIFVLASRHEGMPNALLEAMSCGLPVVVSDASPGPLEFVDDGRNGIVVPAEDPRTLAAALLRLTRDPKLRETLGREARRRLANQSPDTALQVWESVLGLDSGVGEKALERPAG